MAAALLSQLSDAFAFGFERSAAWMRDENTPRLLRSALNELGLGDVDAAAAKRLLAILFMASDPSSTFSGEDHDRIMCREAVGFRDAFVTALHRHVNAEPPSAKVDVVRAVRFFTAWQRKDRAAMEANRRKVLEALLITVAQDRARQRVLGLDPLVPPEPLFADLRETFGADGEAHEAEARRLFGGDWASLRAENKKMMTDVLLVALSECAHDVEMPQEQVDAAHERLYADVKRLEGEDGEARARLVTQATSVQATDLLGHVTEIAHRAFWDAIREEVEAGKTDALLAQVEELQRAMRALVAHSQARSAELADRFDAAWLRQRIEADALDADDLVSLMAYVCETLCEWQAPVDEAEAREWAARHAERARTADPARFMADAVLPFVRECIGRVQTVYKRLVELGDRAYDSNVMEQD